MKRFIIATVGLLLSSICAFGQGVPYFPQTLPPGTVIGRSNQSPGAPEAIPFSILATTFTYTDSATGSVARTYQSKFDDILSVKDFGAQCNGSAIDTTAITAALAVPGHKYNPSGLCITSLASTAIPGPLWGWGQIVDSTPNHRAPWISELTGPPSTIVNFPTSVETAFNGDLSHVQIAMEHRISGAATLGQPATGYIYTPEASPIYMYFQNSSGFNNDVGDNNGRTAAVAYFTRVDQFGQGDAVAYNADVFVNAARAGATSYLANPAGTIINGQVEAGLSGVYLNAGEFLISDQGFDTAAAGWVVNLQRTANIGSLNAWWVGYRAQSVGTKASDVAFSASGSYNYGLDLSQATFGSNNAAITLASDQKIYGGVTADGSGLSRFPGGLGTTNYITFASGISGWNFIVNATSIFQATANQVTATQPFRVASAGGLGYTTGAGGTVTQATSKSTAVTLNTATGVITMNNAALAAGTQVGFQLNDSQVAAADTVIASQGSGGSVGAYTISTQVTAPANVVFQVKNITGGSLSEAVTINFSIIRGSTN